MNRQQSAKKLENGYGSLSANLLSSQTTGVRTIPLYNRFLGRSSPAQANDKQPALPAAPTPIVSAPAQPECDVRSVKCQQHRCDAADPRQPSAEPLSPLDETNASTPIEYESTTRGKGGQPCGPAWREKSGVAPASGIPGRETEQHFTNFLIALLPNFIEQFQSGGPSATPLREGDLTLRRGIHACHIDKR